MSGHWACALGRCRDDLETYLLARQAAAVAKLGGLATERVHCAGIVGFVSL